jgi:cytoplasmic iron level regulating protein YaaA (DUF328/UPF0246 family)
VSKIGVFRFLQHFDPTKAGLRHLPSCPNQKLTAFWKKNLTQIINNIFVPEEDIIRKTVGSEELRPNIVMV